MFVYILKGGLFVEFKCTGNFPFSEKNCSIENHRFGYRCFPALIFPYFRSLEFFRWLDFWQDTKNETQLKVSKPTIRFAALNESSDHSSVDESSVLLKENEVSKIFNMGEFGRSSFPAFFSLHRPKMAQLIAQLLAQHEPQFNRQSFGPLGKRNGSRYPILRGINQLVLTLASTQELPGGCFVQPQMGNPAQISIFSSNLQDPVFTRLLKSLKDISNSQKLLTKFHFPGTIHLCH